MFILDPRVTQPTKAYLLSDVAAAIAQATAAIGFRSQIAEEWALAPRQMVLCRRFNRMHLKCGLR